MHGFEEAEELLGNNLSIFHNEEQLKNDVGPFNRKVIEKGYNTGEVDHIRRDGTMFPTQMTTTMLRDENGNPIAIAGVATDITDRKQAEEELAKHREHLEEMVEQRTKELKDAQEDLVRAERLATLGQFSGNISHELRNPLGVIDSSIYYLKMKLRDEDEKVTEHLDRIKSSVGSATGIIQSLLDLTRIKEPQLKKLDLMQITSEAINTSKVPTKVKAIQTFADQEIFVNADEEQLRMAFENIITNAVDAMAGEGILTVTVHATAQGKTEVSFADTGPGIAPENLDKVFQPLFSTKAKGIGFGLSITKMIIEKHGGTIQARSEPGEGATIIVRLPLFGDIKAKGENENPKCDTGE